MENKKKSDQKLVNQVDEIQDKFGGRKPEYINMYFAAKLKYLTTVLIYLTIALSVLAIVQIILLIRN